MWVHICNNYGMLLSTAIDEQHLVMGLYKERTVGVLLTVAVRNIWLNTFRECRFSYIL